jgi:hypothetical protein
MNGVAAPLLDPADNVPLGSIAVAADEQRLPPGALAVAGAHHLPAIVRDGLRGRG